MIARVAATDTPTTQIAAVNTSNPAGPRRPGGAGTAAPAPASEQAAGEHGNAHPALAEEHGDLVVLGYDAAVGSVDHEVGRLPEVVHEVHRRARPYRHRPAVRVRRRADAQQPTAALEGHARGRRQCDTGREQRTADAAGGQYRPEPLS